MNLEVKRGVRITIDMADRLESATIGELANLRELSHVLYLVVSGSGRIQYGAGELAVTRGTSWLMPAGLPVYLRSSSSMQVYAFPFEASSRCECEADASDELPSWPVGIPVPGDEAMLHQAGRLYELSRAKQTALLQQLEMQAILAQMVVRLWKDAGQQTAACIDRTGASSARQALSTMERVLGHIHQRYDQTITRQELVELAGVSTRSFSDQFKAYTGMSFSDYLNQLRVDKAKELLLRRQKLKDVAQQVGYSDEFYLSRKFKQATGMSPMVYLKKPKRYASLDHAFTIDMLSIGVAPCAGVTDSWLNRRFDRLLSGDSFHPLYWGTQVSQRNHLLAVTKPDVILAVDQGREELELLERIAPVLQIPWRDVHWREHFRIVAELVHREQQAGEWLDRFDDKVENARLRIQSFMSAGETVAILNVRSDAFYIYAQGYMGADLLYDSLKLSPPTLVTDMRSRGQEHPDLMVEQLPQVDADYVFLAVERTEVAMRRAREIMTSPEWRSLLAVQREQVFVVDMTKWYGYGPAVLDAQLDDVLFHLNLKI